MIQYAGHVSLGIIIFMITIHVNHAKIHVLHAILQHNVCHVEVEITYQLVNVSIALLNYQTAPIVSMNRFALTVSLVTICKTIFAMSVPHHVLHADQQQFVFHALLVTFIL
jgi:hypothetical protein